MSYSQLKAEAEVFDIKAERERRKDQLKIKPSIKVPAIEFKKFNNHSPESSKKDGDK